MTTPLESIAKLCPLPELKLIQVVPPGFFICEKVSDAEVWPRCASLCKTIYDHRWVVIRDPPIRDKTITIKILKRRFWCKVNLKYAEREALYRYLQKHPKLHELYQWKERLHFFYRIKGYGRAYMAYKKLIDHMSVSFLIRFFIKPTTIRDEQIILG